MAAGVIRHKRLHILGPVVIEPMNGTARNTEGLPGANFDLHALDGPRQHACDPVNRLLVMVMAMSWSGKTLPTRDHKLKGRDASGRVLSCDQETDHERSQRDWLVGRVGADVAD